MPRNSKVGRCVRKVQKKGHSKKSAIRICQTSTKQSYRSGRRSRSK